VTGDRGDRGASIAPLGVAASHLPRLLTEFAAYQAGRGFSVRTIARRAWSLGKFHEHLDGIPLDKVTAADVEVWLYRFPSAQSRYSMRSDVRQWFRFLIRRGYLTTNPTDDVEPPRLPKRAATPIPAVQVRRAIDTASPRTRLMIMCGCFAGMRVAEIARLHTRDITNELIIVRGGKGGHDRLIPLAPELALALLHVPDGPVFPNTSDHAVSDAIRHHFRKIGIQHRPHDLRHSFGTELAKITNGNLLQVQRLMGHASAQTTQRYIGWAPAGAEYIAQLFQ